MTVVIQRASTEVPTPSDKQLIAWAKLALAASASADGRELTVRIVDEAEITALNRVYRNKNSATNVLSFSADAAAELPAGLPVELQAELAGQLGDIAICAAVVAREAVAQNKPAEAHWAHMTIHGVLHLLGFDHINDDDAATMETLEIKLLAKLGYSNPYHSN